MPGPLSRSPLSSEFWGGIGSGLREQVAAPMVGEVRQGHRTLNEQYPLPYQVAQMHPAVAIPAAALSYADAYDAQDSEGMVKAALSSIPVAERAFRVGAAVPQTLRQAGQVVGAQHGVSLAPALGAVYKAGAASNVTEMGEAAYAQTNKLRSPR